MCDPLGKNLLLPSWFVEDFKEESFASLLGIFWCIGFMGEEFSAFLQGIF